MLPNGLLLVLEMALAERQPPLEWLSQVVYGMFREDVVIAGPFVAPSPSLGHLWPRSRKYVDRFADDPVSLGAALHVLIDMACPAHAHPVMHAYRDPFERYVDTHTDELRGLPVPHVEPAPLPELVTSLAAAAREHGVIGAPMPWHRLGLGSRRRGPAPHDIPAQARALIPLAAGHVRAALGAAW